jgi:MFS family permease
MAASVFAAGLIAVSRSRSLVVSLVLMAIIGFGMMLNMVSSNTLIQTVVEDDKRGRVMSLYTMAFVGMTPIGSLISGTLASAIGTPNTVLIGGLSCLTGALVFARQIPGLKKAIHPIFVKKGILPPVAAGIQTASELTAPPEQ